MVKKQICEYCKTSINLLEYEEHINKHYYTDFINCNQCKGSYYKNIFFDHYKYFNCKLPDVINIKDNFKK